MSKALEYFKQLEVSHRTRGAMHPDQCPKLKLHGVEFAIPPRGVTVVPVFGTDGSVDLSCDGVDEWPELPDVLARLDSCISDDSPIIRLQGQIEDLTSLFVLAHKALSRQYDLSDEEVSELLSFDVHSTPSWIEALYRWAIGLTPEPTEAETFATMRSEIDNVLTVDPDPIPAEPEPAPTFTPWWRRIFG